LSILKFISSLLFVFIVSKNISYAAPIHKKVQFDSSVVKISIPSKSAEQKVFKEVNLDFAKKIEDKDIGLWDRFWKWLLELLFGNADYETRLNAQKIVVWILAIAGFILIIWLLTRTQFTSFLRGNTKNTPFNFSDLEEDISQIDFNSRINKAIDTGDYRLAIRWMYLKQLYLLNEKKAINYQSYKTNIDYSHELSSTSFTKTFKSVSRIYDYVWYGKYPITVSDFQAFETEFKQFEQSINV
jgi:hypothetical protein